MSDRLKMPPVADFGFYQRRKHDKWRCVQPPTLEAPVADSHAHVHMLPDPVWELARCAANGVDFLCMIVDPSEDGPRPFDELRSWQERAGALLAGSSETPRETGAQQASAANSSEVGGAQTCPSGVAERASSPNGPKERGFEADARQGLGFAVGAGSDSGRAVQTCAVRIAAGVHPHNAKLYDAAIQAALRERLADPRVVALGEIGLDYHYDLSPRDVQRRVFRRQVELACELHLPIALHLRGGADPQANDAHAEAFAILREMGALGERTLLHCCALPPEQLQPWVDSGCYVAYGGALTFKSADAARAGARLVPIDRLLLETDAPYMTPEPMRGAACTPAHVVFTAAALAEVRGASAGEPRRAFLQQLHDNTLRFYRKIGNETTLDSHSEGER